jgi:putative ABC transport system permease protein
MLVGDTSKYVGMIFGVAFSVLLIGQQSSVFLGLLSSASAAVKEVRDADIWVMDPRVQYVDGARGLPDTALQRVMGVPGVHWAVPHLRTLTTIATSGVELTSASLVGVDDATLVGLPASVVAGSREALNAPGSVMLNSTGWTFLFGERSFEPGLELELNETRSVVVGLLDTKQTFGQDVQIYARYSTAQSFSPGGRNRLSFVLAKSAPGEDPQVVAKRIEEVTGLKALSKEDFRKATQDYVIFNTGIPQSFGSVVTLDVIVGIVVVALTFSLFIRDNARQFGALRAVGVSAWQLTGMVMLQGALVGAVGYAIGLGLAAWLVEVSSENVLFFRDFFLPWQVAGFSASVVTLIIIMAGISGLRRVLKLDPATVFRG